MGALEIVALIAGGIIFLLSFILPKQKEEVSGGTRELAKEEIKALVSQEMDSVRSHVDDVVDEAVSYAVEKTERSLERLTNEKIMAVNEYSDTVLQEIHKNHEEVMFLYDMLNSKHANLKNTVSEVNKTVREAEETKREAEVLVNSFQHLNLGADTAEAVRETNKTERKAQDGNAQQGQTDLKVQEQLSGTESDLKALDTMDVGSMQEEEGQADNNNEKILALYRQGKSHVAIARELGLGVGEVKLVIDLYKNM